MRAQHESLMHVAQQESFMCARARSMSARHDLFMCARRTYRHVAVHVARQRPFMCARVRGMCAQYKSFMCVRRDCLMHVARL